MSENIEFIPAKDLPEATGNEVSVVCLENGELKQKPGASLGGGSYDMKVRIWVEWAEGDNGTHPELKLELLEGDYESALAKINKFEPVIVRTVQDMALEDVPDDTVDNMDIFQRKATSDSYAQWVRNPDGEEFLYVHDLEMGFIIFPDNTVERD